MPLFMPPVVMMAQKIRSEYNHVGINMLITTTHYRQRCQQRGVNPEVVDWLLKFGDEFHDHHGATLLLLTQRGRAILEQEVGKGAIRRFHEQLNAYLVVGSDGVLITVGKRYKRIKH